MANRKSAALSAKKPAASLARVNVTRETAKAPTGPLAAVTATTAATKYPRQELYLNKVDTYVKLPAERKKKIEYIKKKLINGVRMYGIGGNLDASLYPYMRDFIGELRAAGCFRVGVAWSSPSMANKLNLYNDSGIHADGSTKFDSVISEIEPYVSNPLHTWPQMFALLDAMKAWAALEPKPVETSYYMGWFHKPTGTDEKATVLRLMSGVDVAYLHCYVPGRPFVGYLFDRIKLHANAAKFLGYNAADPFKIVPIYSMEREFSGPYMKALGPQSFNTLHDYVMAEYNKLVFPNKECISIEGYIIFKESDALTYNP